MRTFSKDPNAVLDYVMDWARWLGTDTIVASVWVVPTGLVKTSDSHTDTQAKVWLSGGVKGRTFTVTNRITTAAGRTDDRSFLLEVNER